MSTFPQPTSTFPQPTSTFPQPTAQVAAVPALTPFVAPEELARRVGRASLLRLGANESAFGPSPKAIAAMREAVEVGTRAQAEAMVRKLLELGVFVRKPHAPPIDGFIRVTVGTAAERVAFAASFAEALAAPREKAAVF